MQSRFLLFLAVSLIPFSASAQTDSTALKPRYFFSVHAGALVGKDGNAPALTSSLIQGVRYKRFSAGVGVGHDVYTDWRTVPVFGSLSYHLAGRRKNAVLAGLNAGYSRVWNPALEQMQFIDYSSRGNFFHPFIAYRIASGSLRAYVCVGYKFQKVTYEHLIDYWSPWRSDSTRTVKREMQRLSVEIGIGFR